MQWANLLASYVGFEIKTNKQLIDNNHGRLSAHDEENDRAFRWVIHKFEKLVGLKARNDHLTDVEYRKLAEDIVRANDH